MDMMETLARLFTQGERLAHYRPPSGLVRVPWHPEILEASLTQPGGSPATLRVYPLARRDGIEDILRLQWRNEVVAAVRLSHARHRALPKVLDAGLYLDDGFGFVLTADIGTSTDDVKHPVSVRLTEDKVFAYRQFVSVVEALALIHREGLMHRLILPSAVRARRVRDGQAVLDGFVLSGFTRTWLRQQLTQGPADEGYLREVEGHFFLAPERHPDGPRTMIEGPAADVFSIGMLGLSWLVLHHSRWPTSGAFDAAEQREVLELLHEMADETLPTPLAKVLRLSTQTHPANRPSSAGELLDALLSAQSLVTRELQGGSDATYDIRYLVETHERLNDGGYVIARPQRPGGGQECIDFIRQDIDGGYLVFSPEGFWGYAAQTQKDAMRAAKLVIVGHECMYFCDRLRKERDDLREDNVLLIRYIAWGAGTEDLRRSSASRPMPESFEVDSWTLGGANSPIDPHAGSWAAIIEELEHETAAPDSSLVRAAHWRLQVHDALLRRERYFFEVGEQTASTVTLAQASDDIEGRRSGYDELAERAEKRPPLGDVFRDYRRRCLEDGNAPECVVSKADQEERLELKEVLDASNIQLRLLEDTVLPTAGLVSPDQRGTLHSLRTQTRALEALRQRQEGLHEQMLSPFSLKIPMQPGWDAPLGDLEAASTSLVETVLTNRPFFVLQGPPGTGKTFTCAAALAAYLEAEPFDRVLVSAQSHFALDNLVESVVARLEGDDKDWLLLRVVTEASEDKPAEHAQRLRVDRVLERIVRRVLGSEAAGLPPGASDVAKQWRGLVDQLDSSATALREELIERIRASATVVFATTGASTDKWLGGWRSAALFDWVVVEEAAKGWVTEVLVPLVRGASWLLIGDHVQLPAFDSRRFKKLLRLDIEHQDTTATSSASPNGQWLEWLSYFERLMSHRDDTPCVHRLNVQRRMHPKIARLVSEVFYEGELESHPTMHTDREHGRQDPEWLQERQIVWLDTAEFDQRFEDARLRNDFERHVVNWLFTRVLTTKAPEDPTVPRAVVLSPYRRQCDHLRNRLKGIPEKPEVHTVDSFQGKQAEEVVISMVRSNLEGQVGFMTEPSRLNVLISRARRLLVFVGDFQHFQEAAGQHADGYHLSKLLDWLDEEGAVLDLASTRFQAPGGGR